MLCMNDKRKTLSFFILTKLLAQYVNQSSSIDIKLLDRELRYNLKALAVSNSEGRRLHPWRDWIVSFEPKFRFLD